MIKQIKEGERKFLYGKIVNNWCKYWPLEEVKLDSPPTKQGLHLRSSSREHSMELETKKNFTDTTSARRSKSTSTAVSMLTSGSLETSWWGWHFVSVVFLPRALKYQSSHEKNKPPHEPQMRDSLLTTVLPQTIKILKDKESLRNCPSQE